MMRLAQIGAGYWGRHLLRNFLEAEGAQVTMVCDHNPASLAALAKRHPGLICCREAREVFAAAELEAVAIATPPDSHFALAQQALAAGLHVFVEKPLAPSVRECETLVELAQSRQRVLMVGHTFLYDAAVQRIKAYLQEGLAGEIYYITSRRLNLGIVRREVDAMWNLAPHDLSIILHWLGESPVAIAVHGNAYLQPGIADVAFLHLRFASGVAAHIQVSWLDPNKVRQMTIVGAQKMIVYDDVHPDHKIQLFDKGITRHNLAAHLGEFDTFGAFQLIRRAGDLLIPKVDLLEPLKAQCQHFIDCIRANQRPLSDGENGLAVVRILAAGSRSLQRGGECVQI